MRDIQGFLLIVAFMLFMIAMVTIGFVLSDNTDEMKACVASGDHSWVQKRGDYYECVPDSEVTR